MKDIKLPSCKKVSYRSRSDAIRGNNNNHNKDRAIAYDCEFCDSWHLTTMTKKEIRSVKKSYSYHKKLHGVL